MSVINSRYVSLYWRARSIFASSESVLHLMGRKLCTSLERKKKGEKKFKRKVMTEKHRVARYAFDNIKTETLKIIKRKNKSKFKEVILIMEKSMEFLFHVLNL